MKIFIDFDGVIFNTKLFKKQIFKIFNGRSSYKEFEKRRIPYSPLTHFKFLSADLNKLLKNSKHYVLSDAKEFLNQFSKNKLYLISYGDLKFQKQKIKAAGISKYFKKIIIADKNKADIIRKLIRKGERAIFIDDKSKHIKEIKEMKNKNIITFRLVRPKNNFKNIEKMIKNG